MLDQIRTNISFYINHFLFEILDDYTNDIMEKGIKTYLRELKIFDYKLITTKLDKSNVKIQLSYDDNITDFMVSRG